MSGEAKGPDVIVVHVPKTAGAAFTYLLEDVYGKENVENDKPPAWRSPVDSDFDAWNRETSAALTGRTSWPRVITGHFWLGKYEAYRGAAYTIVWLREPAERLLSMFFYLRSRPETDPSGSFARSVPLESLLDIEWPSNLVSRRFLRGYDLDDLDFVGIQEHFADDVADLGRSLNWPAVEITVHNRTTSAEYRAFRPSAELLAKILSRNEEDLELYQRALERRRRRLRAMP